MKTTIKIISLVLALIVVFSSVCVVSAAKEETKVIRDITYTGKAAELWTSEDVLENALECDLTAATVDGVINTNTEIVLKKGSTLNTAFVTDEKDYLIYIRYRTISSNQLSIEFEITVDNVAPVNGAVPVLWQDSQVKYDVDRDGNELSPDQVPISEWVLDSVNALNSLNSDDLVLSLASGSHNISIKSSTQEVEIDAVYLVEKSEIPSYKEYSAKYSSIKPAKDIITIEAERYAVKSSSSIRGVNSQTPSVAPYKSKEKLINIISSGWSTVGDEAAWEFTVKETGYYRLAFKYNQNADTNMPVYRDIKIDGKVPFKELCAVKFENTGTNKWSNHTVKANGKDAYIYLEKGVHTISLRAVMGSLAEQYDEIMALMKDINTVGTALTKLTAGSTDKNKTWDLEQYMPNAVDDLKSYAKRARKIYKNLEKIGGKKPVYADNLIYAAEILEKLCEEPRTIPNHTEQISVGDSSASKFLGTVISKIINQPIALDRIYVYGNQELPDAQASFWTVLLEWIKSFLYSFTYNPQGSADEDQLEVWVQRSIPYIQVLQQIVDSDYNAKNKTDIQLSVMPSEQKLILANAAGTAPDVVLSVSYATPFNLAIRGAAKDLTEYDDFLKFYDEEYSLEALVPLAYNGGVYGAVETQDFYVLFYRKDILQSLEMEVPETWDDIKSSMPLLLRNSMNFYIPLSQNTSYKSMAVTGPFLYQNNAGFYADDGMSVTITEDNALDAFEEMTDIYKTYGMSTAVASFFNSFRYGEIPLGISSFSTYLTLEIAAPELAGLWGIALAPGTRQEDGSVLRYQMADSTACMILESTDKEKEAWRFVKWWLSSETQLTYSNLIQNTLGTEFRWNTSNIKAFEQLPYAEEDKAIILEMWENQRENARHPANYMVEREISNAWNNIIVNGKGLVESVESAALISNREIIRKMQEFGFCDENGKILEDYSMANYETLKAMMDRS